MKKNEKKQIIILSLILLFMISILIVYPVTKISLKSKNKKNIKNHIIKIINEVNNYYKDNSNFDNDYQIFTIDNYNIVEEGLEINEKLPKTGVIYINKDGKVQIIANDGEYCITKKYDDDNIDISNNNECKLISSIKMANINIVLSSDEKSGLYKNGNEYIFKGENPNNYIKINNSIYRILKIDKNNNISITGNRIDNIKWDNTNNNSFSLIRESNVGYYLTNNDYFKDLRTYINFVENEYSSYLFNSNDLSYPIKESKFSSVISLMNVNDYIYSSLDTSCKKNNFNNNNCGNNNWLKESYDYFTLDKSKDFVYAISNEGKIYEALSNSTLSIKPVFTLKNNIKFKGKGTIDIPYEIVTK